LLRQEGVEFTYEPDAQAVVGVTKARCGLADTGSILVAAGAGHPLEASLLPEVHIAVLKTADILPSLSDALPFVGDKSAAVFITGPSRTADIEMALTIGVHGPKEIYVFLVS
ncbi:MAG: lactate utilization protein, partial [Chloroflexi bacterium]|nr:lactate utilization protein [Chloroflexota bacterium]